MGRELQKRKNRSSRPTVRQPNRRKRALNPSGNQLIAQNWDKKATLSQNYRRLGLVAKLGHSTGGTGEPRDSPLAAAAGGGTGAANKSSSKKKSKLDGQKALLEKVYSEARVERDPDTGRIVRIIRTEEVGSGKAGGKRRENPLGDLLARFDSDSEGEEEEDGDGDNGEEWGGIEEDEEDRPAVVRQLEAEANAPREKTVRHQSERELEWLERLVERHGDDTGAMAKDPRLNPMQQTASDLRRRLRKAGLLE